MADASQNNQANLEVLREYVGGLAGPSRRRRQEAAHKIAVVAKSDPELVAEFIPSLIDALEQPEAQTRWEVLDALSALCDSHATKLSGAFDGAETALFDEGSAPVRLAAFTFLCHYGATTAKRSDQVWPLLDEAIQCYHGDAEYRDMLVALLFLAQSKASAETKEALAARLSFDAENGSGFVKSNSAEIVAACK